eukprot:gene6797-9310_t
MDSKTDDRRREFGAIFIPSSLRTIQPFLEDTQKFIRNAYKSKDSSNSYKYMKVALSCINHAFKLNSILNPEINNEDRACLEEFNHVRSTIVREISALNARDAIFKDMGLSDADLPSYNSVHIEELGTHELLIAEADTVLALADELLEEGLRFDAMLNYHTACVFYRVMETMIPSKTSSSQHSRLMYASAKVRQCSTLYQNFVRENFVGGSCSDMYEVHGTSKLGKGSYGSVYLATHRVTGDERAVKVMNVDRITSYYLRKLHTEIAILKSLDHPNIIKLQDVFFGKRSVYIVTDLCRGGELFELLNSGKNQGFVFREDRASKLMRDMLSAVNYLHENGIVHRDLKLENFLFEDHNSNSPLILIDFGLSKHFSPEEKLTQKVGSCYYTAPEVLNGNYDFRCDIWSLGVLCYMLLSGTPPFFGKSVEDVYHSILTKEASFQDKKFKHVSNSCMDFMKRLLVREPKGRLTTSEALQHPFITGASFFPRYQSIDVAKDSGESLSALPPAKANQIMESMVFFAKADPLTKLTIEMVSHSLGATEIQQFREEFQLIDRTHFGSISLRDFSASFMNVDAHILGNMDLKTVFNLLSIDHGYGHKKELTYHEYISASMHRRVEVSEQRLSLMFSYMDLENKGQLTAAMIRNSLGDDLSTAELDSMIEAADSNGDRQITKRDFYELWRIMWSQGRSEGK